MPVFDGLFPEPHNKRIQNLLFELATWHALAKLRLHTSTTLQELGTSTTRLGILIRQFAAHTCTEFDTRKLPKELAARARRKARVQAAATGKQKGKQRADDESEAEDGNKKEYNPFTYKLHALGHYVQNIKSFGTTDNYTTQHVREPLVVLCAFTTDTTG
jgi:hypothetical protein